MKRLLSQPVSTSEKAAFYGIVLIAIVLIPVVRDALNLPPTVLNWMMSALIAGVLGGFAGSFTVTLLRRRGG